MSQEENNRMQALNSSSDELVNYLEEALNDREENGELEFSTRRLDENFISVPNLVDEEHPDDLMEPTDKFNDNVGKKRQRKKAEPGLEKSKKKKKQNSETSLEIKEMWDSITNNNINSKDSDNVVEHFLTKEEARAEIDKLFHFNRKKKSKCEKTPMEIAMQVEEVIANLEIAVEDDVELNREGKPAINKLMKLPLLIEALSKKPLQAKFLDHGVLNFLKNWLEPLPDGSLPNINIRATILTILNDLPINLDTHSRREQFIKSGLGKVIMFLSKSDEETTPNKRLATDLLNKWGRIIYNKSTRYDNMYTQEEIEEEQRILLRRQTKTAPKVSQIKARDFNVDVDLTMKPKSKLGPLIGVGRAQIPKAMSMDFKIRPNAKKIDKELEARVKWQLDNSGIHENIMEKLKEQNINRRRSMQAFKPSLDGHSKPKYLKAPLR